MYSENKERANNDNSELNRNIALNNIDGNNVDDAWLYRKGIDASDIVTGLHLLRNEEFRKYHLSKREKQVASYILDGSSNINIAKAMFMSLSTVKWDTHCIYAKMGVMCRNEFYAAIRNGIDHSRHKWRNAAQLRRDGLSR